MVGNHSLKETTAMHEVNNVFFITGECLSHYCWEEWKVYFDKKGFNTFAPAWKYKDAPAEILRSRHPDDELATLGLEELVDHYRKIINTLGSKPVVIAHGNGNVITSRLAKEELLAGVVLIEENHLRTWFRNIMLRGIAITVGKSPSFLIPYCLWQTAFAYHMPRQWQQDSYKLMIPESVNVLHQLHRNRLQTDNAKTQLPVLRIAITGRKAGSIDTDSRPHSRHRFGMRNFLFMVQPGWQEIAGCIADWLTQNFSPIKTPSI